MILSVFFVQPKFALTIQVAKHGACLQINVRNLSSKELVVPQPDSDGLVPDLHCIKKWRGRKPDTNIYDFPTLIKRSYWRIPPKKHSSIVMKIDSNSMQAGMYEGTIRYDDSLVETRTKGTLAGVTQIGKSQLYIIKLSISESGICKYLQVKTSK